MCRPPDPIGEPPQGAIPGANVRTYATSHDNDDRGRATLVGVEKTGITFYEAVGGAPTFERLVARFYEGVASDPVLRPLYPEPELAAAEERLRLFLIQYWGGP